MEVFWSEKLAKFKDFPPSLLTHVSKWDSSQDGWARATSPAVGTPELRLLQARRYVAAFFPGVRLTTHAICVESDVVFFSLPPSGSNMKAWRVRVLKKTNVHLAGPSLRP